MTTLEDEVRAKFEAWREKSMYWAVAKPDPEDDPMGEGASVGGLMNIAAWETWQACAALSAQSQAVGAVSLNEKRYLWLRDQLIAANFNWEESGETVLIFGMPEGISVSADCDDTIDAAMTASPTKGQQ